jgi:hypothetical protein
MDWSSVPPVIRLRSKFRKNLKDRQNKFKGREATPDLFFLRRHCEEGNLALNLSPLFFGEKSALFISLNLEILVSQTLYPFESQQPAFTSL